MADEDAFAQLPAGSYKGVVFPVISVQLHTGSAAAFHKFPYKPGQRIEYTGREPVAGVMLVAMFNSLTQFTGGGNNGMWPRGVQLLREKCQEQVSGPLVVPPFGTLLKAYVRMSESYTGAVRNGAYVQLDFTEDSSDVIQKGSVAVKPSIAQQASVADLELAAAKIKLQLRLEDADSLSGDAIDLLSAIQILTASIANIDQDLTRPIRQIDAIVAALDNLVETSSALTSPANWNALDAVLALKDTLLTTVQDALSIQTPIKSFTTVGDMSVAAVAKATNNTVEDILKLNVLGDPMSIAPGELLLVYDI